MRGGVGGDRGSGCDIRRTTCQQPASTMLLSTYKECRNKTQWVVLRHLIEDRIAQISVKKDEYTHTSYIHTRKALLHIHVAINIVIHGMML